MQHTEQQQKNKFGDFQEEYLMSWSFNTGVIYIDNRWGMWTEVTGHMDSKKASEFIPSYPCSSLKGE